MRVLLLTIIFCLTPGKACADDAFVFEGRWSVHPKMTMEYAKNSPKYNPVEDVQFEKTMLRIMGVMTIMLSEDKMVHHSGQRSSVIFFKINETTSTSAEVSGGLENTSFTLIFTMIDGQYMNFKSSGSDDMDYYIWQRENPKPASETSSD